jgi:acyl-CoA thioesterase I
MQFNFRISVLTAIAFLIVPCSFAQEMSKFLSLGDSYTYGESVPSNEKFHVQLYEAINDDYTWTEPTDIAQTGWRTDDLLNAISEAKLDYNYDFVTLLIGVNNQYQGRPFSQYEKEFITLLDSSILFAQSDPNHVFVLSIPDYYFTPFGQEQKGEWVSEEIDRYNAYAKSVCDSLHVSFIDITPISRRGIEEPELIANDGLHPSGVQYKLWVEKLLMEMESQQLR